MKDEKQPNICKKCNYRHKEDEWSNDHFCRLCDKITYHDEIYDIRGSTLDGLGYHNNTIMVDIDIKVCRECKLITRV